MRVSFSGYVDVRMVFAIGALVYGASFIALSFSFRVIRAQRGLRNKLDVLLMSRPGTERERNLSVVRKSLFFAGLVLFLSGAAAAMWYVPRFWFFVCYAVAVAIVLIIAVIGRHRTYRSP